MISRNGYIDGSWKLTVLLTDFNQSLGIRVFNHTRLSEIRLELGNSFNINSKESENYGFWCPDSNCWLNCPKNSLFQLALNASSRLQFVRKIRFLKVEFNSQVQQISVDFSKPLGQLFKSIYQNFSNNYFHYFGLHYRENEDENGPFKQLGSLSNNQEICQANMLKLNSSTPTTLRYSKNLHPSVPWTPTSGYGSLSLANSLDNLRGSLISIRDYFQASRSNLFSEELFKDKGHPANVPVKDKISGKNHWLSFNKSLMEQNISEHLVLQLKLKYPEFLILNCEHSRKMMDELYGNVRSSVLSQETEINMTFLLILASLNYHAILVAKSDPSAVQMSTRPTISIDHEINLILNNLEELLLPKTNGNDYEIYSSYKIFNVLLTQIHPKSTSHERDVVMVYEKKSISIFKDRNFTKALHSFNVEFCKLELSIIAKSKIFNINWKFKQSNRFFEIVTAFQTEEDFTLLASEATACINFSSPSDKEVAHIKSALHLTISILSSSTVSSSGFSVYNMPKVELSDLLGKYAGKGEFLAYQLKQILKHYETVRKNSLTDTKLKFLSIWSALPRFNFRYFRIQHETAGRETAGTRAGESLLALNPDKLLLLELGSELGTFVARWSELQTWRVNSDNNHVELLFPDAVTLSFVLLDCCAQSFHEVVAFCVWFKLHKMAVSHLGCHDDQFSKYAEIINATL